MSIFQLNGISWVELSVLVCYHSYTLNKYSCETFVYFHRFGKKAGERWEKVIFHSYSLSSAVEKLPSSVYYMYMHAYSDCSATSVFLPRHKSELWCELWIFFFSLLFTLSIWKVKPSQHQHQFSLTAHFCTKTKNWAHMHNNNNGNLNKIGKPYSVRS